jgi:hypothetical protein
MKTFNKRAFSVVEYTVLFVIIIGAFLIMRNYIQRGVFGMWGQSGQSLAFGRQYDPQKTVQCDFDEVTNVWYDHNCAASQCPNGDSNCIEGAVSGCRTSSCNQATQ